MDSRRRLLILALFVFSMISAASAMKAAVRSSAEKVQVAMYYETLCPYCERFMVKELYKIFENGLIDIVDLKLSPYGNAKIGPNNTITCQHGPYECLLNTIEACAIHIWPDVKEHFPFILCLETLVYEGRKEEWDTCFATLNIDPKPVTDCYTSGFGHTLDLELAADTNALQPRHTYVPWVTLNGRPLYDDYYILLSRICRAYKGDDKPEVCDELSARSTENRISNSDRSVCYKEESKKSTLSRISSAIESFFRNINMDAAM